MRNVFLFIRRYFVFISFLVLQFFCLWMLFSYNRFHQVIFLETASEVTGRINKQVDKVDEYFSLREENRRVHRLNDSLLNLLQTNFQAPDTTIQLVVDSVQYDTVNRFRKYHWRAANVVNNSIASQKNYLQINRGSAQGVKESMAVISSDGAVVGLVVNTSTNFSHVMSLLHIHNRVPAALKRSMDWGTVEWEANDPRIVTLTGISKEVEVAVGDSVITSVYSYNYPPGYLIGRISEIDIDQRSGFYVLKIALAARFGRLQQVFVVENLLREEQLHLERETEIRNVNRQR